MNHAKPMVRNFSHPDESMPLAAGSAATVRIGDLMVGRLVQEPGWRWSEQVKPIAGTASCQFHHIGVGLAGKAMTRMDDGTELLVQAGDVFDIPPGHDSWVVGDEPAVSIQWGGWRGWGKRPDGDRILTTMLMTDIAGSTERAAQVGDAAWDQLLDRHHRLIREILERYRATEIDTAGDGFFAIFDGAARAIRAAVDITSAVRELGLEVRAGINTGEVEVVPGGVRGLAVHETARIMSLATGGEILVSSTTRELAVGAALQFEDRGIHELRGVPAPRRVYSVVEPA